MSTVLADVTGPAAQLIAGAALLMGAWTLAITRRPALALGILLDLLVAAGVLRLAGDPSWPAIATAATVVAVRHLVGHGLRIGARSWEEKADRPDRSSRHHHEIRHLLRPAWRL